MHVQELDPELLTHTSICVQLSNAEAEHHSDQATLLQLREQVNTLESAVEEAVAEIEAQASSQAEKDALIADLEQLLLDKDNELQEIAASTLDKSEAKSRTTSLKVS